MAKEYKIHLGEYVKRQIEESRDHIKREIANQLKIEKNSLSERFKRRHYGTVYDLLETSEALGVNLFKPVMAILEKGNIEIDEFYSEEDFALMKEQILGLKKQVAILEEDKAKLFSIVTNLTGEK